jgi:serine/threonine protein kinase
MSATDPIIGKKLGDYIIVDVLGQGGMARVYRGLDKKLNRYAAVKVIDATTNPDQEEYRSRFVLEARAIARLSHPNIVGIYQFDQVGTTYYMAMSFIEGRDLRWVLKNHLKNNTRMSYPEVLRIIQDIASALDYSHIQGVIHRDIKPSNIMVMENGHAILTDFGLALSVPEGTIGNTFGSAHYIAPEQAVSSAHAVPQSDLYSLGVVIYEMLTGRVPFNDASAMSVALKHLNEEPPLPSRYNPNISSAIEQVVMKSLSKDVGKRYATGAELARALEFAFKQGDMADEDTSVAKVAALPGWEELPSKASKLNASKGSGSGLPSITAPDTGSLLDDTPTVTDSKASRPIRANVKGNPPPPPMLGQDQPRRASNRGLIIGGVALVAVIAIIAIVALLAGGNKNNAGADQTSTAAAQAALAGTQTVVVTSATVAASTEAITSEPTAATTEQATTAPTADSVTAAVPTTGATEIAAVATTAPATEPTTPAPTLSETPTPTSIPESLGPVLLHYDAKSLVLLNRSDQTIDVSSLTFARVGSNAQPFETRSWEGGPRPTRSLPAKNCFQVWPNDQIGVLDPPDYCQKRQAWSAIAPQRAFWVSTSNDPQAAFEVRRGSQVLATCTIKAGECAFDPKKTS